MAKQAKAQKGKAISEYVAHYMEAYDKGLSINIRPSDEQMNRIAAQIFAEADAKIAALTR